MIATLIGFLIGILNKGLEFIMGYINNLQIFITKTDEKLSLAKKLIFCMFFNTTIQTLVIKVFIPWNFHGF